MGEVRIVLDDQNDRITRRDRLPVIGNRFRLGDLMNDQRRRPQRAACFRGDADVRPDIVFRQIESKDTASPGRAVEADLSAEQGRQLAADREPETRAAVAPACAGVRLMERFEDDLLLIGGNADAGVLNFEGDDSRRVVQSRVIDAPAVTDQIHPEGDPSLGGEFESIGKQVF